MTVDQARLAVDRTLRQIIVAFRLVAAAWITVLGVLALVEWDARPAIVIFTLVLAWAWTAATAAVPSRVLRGWPWLIADLLIGAWTAVAPVFDGQDDATFSGGFPFSTVLVWAYAFGTAGGVVSGIVVSSIALAPSDNSLTADLTSAIIYVAGGGVAGWGFTMLRKSEGRRLEAEQELARERAERIRSEERAEIAAHLHDSVLQTLALIQMRAEEPSEVGSLARSQERELRNWLYGAAVIDAASVAGALEQVCSELEEKHRNTVELVTVGDCPIDNRLRSLVAATREAIINASKFSGIDQVSVFAEITPDQVRVFVRDRGTGFDPAGVDPDRRGLRESIIGRMNRHGGAATISSSAATGTEIELTMPREEP